MSGTYKRVQDADSDSDADADSGSGSGSGSDSDPDASADSDASLLPQWGQPYFTWLFLAVAVGGTVLALSSFLFSGFVALVGSSLSGVLQTVAVLYPYLGATIVLFALWGLKRTQWKRWQPLGSPQPEDETPPTMKDGMATKLHTATVARYHCETSDAADTIDEELFVGAVRAIQTTHGISNERARETVRSGDWTEDPVAAAFLTDEIPYPLGERLYGRIDPGGAYQHRIRRTLDAIDAIRQRQSKPQQSECDR